MLANSCRQRRGPTGHPPLPAREVPQNLIPSQKIWPHPAPLQVQQGGLPLQEAPAGCSASMSVAPQAQNLSCPPALPAGGPGTLPVPPAPARSSQTGIRPWGQGRLRDPGSGRGEGVRAASPARMLVSCLDIPAWDTHTPTTPACPEPSSCSLRRGHGGSPAPSLCGLHHRHPTSQGLLPAPLPAPTAPHCRPERKSTKIWRGQAGPRGGNTLAKTKIRKGN